MWRGVILFSLVLLTNNLGAQIRTVLVSPVPGNPVASGTALRSALAGIASPSATNRWLVKVEPGIYDVGGTTLPMRSWVDIEGSGIDATVIRGTVDGSTLVNGTLNGASNAELRLVTVTATATAGVPYVLAMFNQFASALRLYRVKFVTSTSGGGTVWGIRNGSSSPLIEECEISVAAAASTAAAYGVVFNQFIQSRSQILRSRITVSGAELNYGVFMIEGQTLNEIRDSKITVSGGQNTYGLYAAAQSSWQGNEAIAIRNTDVSSAGGSVSSSGVHFESGTTVNLDVSHSKIFGHIAPATYGIRQLGTAAMGLQSAAITGFTKTIDSAGNASIASTLLNGGPVTVAGWVGCMGVWDENGVFYANSCPP
jgi:hypothetical protein